MYIYVCQHASSPGTKRKRRTSRTDPGRLRKKPHLRICCLEYAGLMAQRDHFPALGEARGCMCMRACVYFVCMCVCAYIYIYTYIHTYMSIYTRTSYTYVHIYSEITCIKNFQLTMPIRPAGVHMNVSTYGCMHAYKCICMHMYACI
jgi:hypothetical protein